jgi:AcrR family transcriptional regulator
MKNGVNGIDPRVKRTRDLLLHALIDLAAEKDIRSIRVQDIAERATVNRATFYAHYRDKDALLDAAFRGRTREMLAEKLSPTSPLTTDNLRLLFRVVCDILNNTVRRCPRSLGEDHRQLKKEAVQEELQAFLLEWLRQGLPNKSSQGFPLEMLAAFMSWSLFGASVEWASEPTKFSQDVIAAQVVDLLVEGIGNAIPLPNSSSAKSSFNATAGGARP